MDDELLRLVRELSEAHGVPGHEDDVREIFLRELDGCGEITGDALGSVCCASGAGPRVLVAGHMDEVGFLVHSITADGFLRFVPVGGWWEHTLPAQRVIVRTHDGRKIPGVIGSIPPHHLPEPQRRQLLTIEQMFIDVGATSRAQAEIEFGIHAGDPVAPWTPFAVLAGGDRWLAKAFDNRLGMAAAIRIGKMFARSGHPNRLIVAGTVQEEIGMRGARTLAHHCRPEVAIILEGPPADDTPGATTGEPQGRLGGGVQIRAFDPSAVLAPRLVRLAEDVARAEGIPFQLTVRRSGATDAGAVHLARDGVPSIVLGTPARYIHTHNAVVDGHDLMHMVALTAALVRRLDTTTVADLRRFTRPTRSNC